jgi:hypothetical protein
VHADHRSRTSTDGAAPYGRRRHDRATETSPEDRPNPLYGRHGGLG